MSSNRRRRWRCPECFYECLSAGATPPRCGHAIRDRRTGDLLDLRWVDMQPVARMRRPRKAISDA
jgi:hypothetical protein